MKASDITIDKNISILLKSPWGHGKTLAAASFAIDGPIYLAYFDKKQPIELISYFRKMGDRGDRILKNIEFDVYGANNANEYLNKLIQIAKSCRYFAVVTDSVTNLTSAAVNWSLSFRDDRKNKDKLKVIPDFDEYKVETSLVTQALDLCRTMPCHVIWIAHPVPSIKIEGSGASIKVTKVNPIVTYGSKVAGIVPGNFSEIYHLAKQSIWDGTKGVSTSKYTVSLDAVGDDFAKSNLGLTGELDITDKLFYEVWRDRIREKEKEDALANQANSAADYLNPFASTQTAANTTQPENTTHNQSKVWDSEKGEYK